MFWNRLHNDPLRSWRVVDFDTNWKCVWDFLLISNRNLGPIMPHFKDIRAFVCQKPLFTIPNPYSGLNFCVSFGIDTWCWGLNRADTTGKLTVKLFPKNSNLWDHDTSTPQKNRQLLDRQTTCHRNAVLCVASVSYTHLTLPTIYSV